MCHLLLKESSVRLSFKYNATPVDRVSHVLSLLFVTDLRDFSLVVRDELLEFFI